ncbi:Mitochondrial fission protein ELM1 [Camellia lanceoleosa]|uniref:Mitochondrial fission protein ELM1 n=1 Tax=Camellia lanceoleosa TaxID=1840588 RepID=A0ACC0GB10_9ERIC|nr:Mitochondrial fission protein ELM1 [Camellia lanceoleosa]
MRAIRFREPPTDSWGLRDIFRVGFSTAIRRAVVIGNGVAGAENQCIGLVRALGLSHRQTIYRVTRPRGGINNWVQLLPVSVHKKLDYAIKRICGDSQFQTIKANKVMSLPAEKNGSAGSAGLSHVLEADAKQIATMAHETFEKDGPLLVVASGWDTISVASSIKQLAPEKVFVVQIQHPRSQLNRFSLVITPRHDYYPLTPEGQEQIPWFLRRWITPREPPDRHVVLTVGALHQADSTALQVAACAWHDELAPLLKPLLVVNIGGPTKHCQYGADLAKQLTAFLKNVRRSFGSLRISFSRRTPQEVSDILEKEFSYHPKVYIWDGKDPNPHMGHLAWADAFIITADSVSMLSEACSTGKPVYVIGAERCTWKFAEFHKSLQERGVVRPFTGKEDISERWSYPPLNDTAEASFRVIEALSEHGWRLEP